MKIRPLLTGLAVLALGLGVAAPASATASAAQQDNVTYCWACWDPM